MPKPYNFALNITDADIEKAFNDQDWLNSVASATLLGVAYATENTTLNKTPEDILHEIINYNIIKRLQSVFLSKAQPLPKLIEWDNTTTSSFAYDSLENILIQALLLKEANKFEDKIAFTISIKNDVIKKSILNWLEEFRKTYVMFKITCKVIKDKYKIVIS